MILKSLSDLREGGWAFISFAGLSLLPFLIPYAASVYLTMIILSTIIKYFTPDYETAMIKGYKRPVIGLSLCWRCKALKYRPRKSKIRHYDDYKTLEHSGSRGCWVCKTICDQFLLSKQHRESPPVLDNPGDLNVPRLLIWFARHTEIKEGYLDQLKEKSYSQYIYSSDPRSLHHDLSSNASFTIATDWIETCNKEHRCYQGQDSPLPTRVIDLSQEEPYLLVSNGLRAPYVTLSHCWGRKQTLTTTLSTLDERKSKISIESLPQLYRDAALITRRLNIKYLWIDSLCIIQDSNDDWSKESASMGEVYQFAFLTISALDSQDCHQGILTQRAPGDTESLKEDGTFIPLNTLQRPRRNVFKESALCQRAWVLQERLLSPRILYYSAAEMLWECLSCTARESSNRVTAYQPTLYEYQSYQCLDVKMQLILPLDENPSYPISPPSDWYIIVAEYTPCCLTRASDKLPALSGLASIFKRNTSYTYLAGLWEEDFANGLLWFAPIGQGQRNEERSIQPYRGPSWSWVSSNLRIRYKTLVFRKDAYAATDIKLLSSSIQHVGQNPMGEIASAKIMVQAYFQKLFYETQRGTRSCFLYDDEGKRCGSGILDFKDGESGAREECGGLWVTERRVWTFEYFDWDHTAPPAYLLHFLIIERVYDAVAGNCWRRIGLGWAMQWRTGFGTQRSDIVLV
ncbi:heterokaryon incompatibility protein-domain-containing protein [Tricladium varicosporioides]|nr:heterokaryon incompatibility protein-domain-containing protein [Hymenoscyphus varicosporioides]